MKRIRNLFFLWCCLALAGNITATAQEANDATLSVITLSAGTLVPAFDAATTAYTVALPKGTQSVTVSATPTNPSAAVTGTGAVDVATGSGTTTLTVTSSDATATKIYTVNFNVVGNYALSLPGGADGNLSNVAIPALNIASLPVTIEMWYKPDATQNYYSTLWYSRKDATYNCGVQYDRWGDVTKIKGVWGGSAGTGLSTVKPVAGEWNHVALVVTATKKTLYINGVAFEQTGTYTNYPFDVVTYLGWDMPNATIKDRTLKGLIDEFRVWTVERTAQELTDNKYKTLTGTETGLIGYWNFNDKAATATDLTTNGRNGTIAGGTYVLSWDGSDDDNDGIPAFLDNCPTTANVDQADADGDKIGDVCDNDWDNDGVPNATDNCPTKANADQKDTDGNGIGDVCDTDSDMDGIENTVDNCPTTANADQADTDGDGIGNVCDTDLDNDGIANDVDNCPTTANPDQLDIDEDGIGDVCDPAIPTDLNFCMSMPGGADGALSNIDISGINLKTLPYTIEMWVKPNGTQTFNAGLFYSRNSTNNAGVQMGSQWQIDQGRGNIRCMNNIANDYGVTGNIVSNEWNHIAVVITATTRTFYVNGAISVTANPNPETIANTAYDFSLGNLYIGYDSGALNRTFKGLIDEVRVWNTARTADQINANLFNSVPATETGLVGYWNFDDRDLTKATDLTGGKNGTINGAKYTLSDVFAPMAYSSSTLSQESADVNSPSVDAKVARLDVVTANRKNPLSVTAINLSANGTTALTDIANVNVYYTGNNSTFGTANKVASLVGSPTEATIQLTCAQKLSYGTNYFWIAYDVAKNAAKGNSLDVECASVQITGDAVTEQVPTVTAPDGKLTVNADLFIGNTKLTTDVVSTTAQTPTGGANFVSFQQNAIMTYNGYQYVTYWNNAFHVCLARKKLPLGTWEVIEFTDFTVTAARIADNHYSISMGICPNDGTIHLSFDQHGDNLRYRYSKVDLANKPDLVAWSAASFYAKQDYLIAGSQMTLVTYPRFIAKPDGNLLFEHRYGTSGGGDSYIYEYSAATGKWTKTGNYVAGMAATTGSTDNNAYLNGMHYDVNGRLHASWVWRETPDPLTNHDICYVYSDDDGKTWYNHLGNQMGSVSGTPITSNTSGIIVWPLGQNRGLINQESQVVDSKGNIHILQSFLPESDANSTNFWTGRASAYMRHLYKDEAGTWQCDNLGVVGKDRSQIGIDEGDNLYVLLPGYRVYFASAIEKWKKWTPIDLSQAGTTISEGLIDREMLLNESVLSFCFGQTGSKILVPHYLIDKSKPGKGTGINTAVYAGDSFGSFISQKLDVLNLAPADVTYAGEKVSIRTQGIIETELGEAYTLQFTTTGNAKVWINDELVLATGEQTEQNTFPIMLELQPSHKYSVKIEGVFAANNVVSKLEWSSDRQALETVPLTALYGKLVDVTSAVPQTSANGLEVNYSPNPFTNNTVVTVNGEFAYQLFDMNGAIVKSGQAVDQLQIGHNLAKGVYLMKVTQGQSSQSFKLVKM